MSFKPTTDASTGLKIRIDCSSTLEASFLEKFPWKLRHLFLMRGNAFSVRSFAPSFALLIACRWLFSSSCRLSLMLFLDNLCSFLDFGPLSGVSSHIAHKGICIGLLLCHYFRRPVLPSQESQRSNYVHSNQATDPDRSVVGYFGKWSWYWSAASCLWWIDIYFSVRLQLSASCYNF